MTINVGIKTGARFKAVVRNSKTHEITHESPWVNNLVLNTGLTRMGQGTWINRCCVGTGTVEPTVTDVGLTNFKAESTDKIGESYGRNTSGAEYFRWVKLRYRFNTGAATGLISEVGLGWNSANLWNKVLLKNELGEPAPVVVLEDDYLDIIAEIRFFINLPITTGSINLLNKDGSIRSTHDYTITPYYGGYFTSVVFEAITARLEIYTDSPINSLQEPAGYFFAQVISPLTPNSTRSSKVTSVMGLNEANDNHKTLLLGVSDVNYAWYGVSYMSGFQIELNPPIVKNSTQILQHNFLVSWDRI